MGNSSRTIGAINSNHSINNQGNQLMEAINSSNIAATSSRNLSSLLIEVTSRVSSRVTRSGNSHSVQATATSSNQPTTESSHPTESDQPMESNHPTVVTGSKNKVATADTETDLRIEVSYDTDHQASFFTRLL